MSATEILERFRRLPFEERCEVLQRMRDEFEDELTPEQIAEFEQRAEKLRRHPEKGITWEKVREELKSRTNKSRACAGK
jgi:putative addiction module component (TIGR02574 family)